MAVPRLKVFISSVQKEFEQVRQDLKAFLLGDAVRRRVEQFRAPTTLLGQMPVLTREKAARRAPPTEYGLPRGTIMSASSLRGDPGFG